MQHTNAVALGTPSHYHVTDEEHAFRYTKKNHATRKCFCCRYTVTTPYERHIRLYINQQKAVIVAPRGKTHSPIPGGRRGKASRANRRCNSPAVHHPRLRRCLRRHLRLRRYCCTRYQKKQNEKEMRKSIVTRNKKTTELSWILTYQDRIV